MDFSWPEEYLAYRQSVVEFAQQALNEDVIERDQTGTFSAKLWQKCAQFGLQGLAAPKQYGDNLRK